MEGMRDGGIKIIGSAAKERILGGVREDFNERGIDALHERFKDYFDIMNLRPIFVNETQDKDNFEEMRERLNTEPGFVIANHPGYIDVAAIFSSLNRADIKVMVSSRGAEEYKMLLGDEHVIEASKDRVKLVSIIRDIKQHIANGGLFVIFPSGKKDLGQIEFKNGFPLLVSQVDPDTMVYNFYFDEDDSKKIEEELPVRTLGMTSELFLSPSLNINNLKDPKFFKIRESYTKASEWQDKIDTVDKEKRAEAATEHYKDIFGIK